MHVRLVVSGEVKWRLVSPNHTLLTWKSNLRHPCSTLNLYTVASKWHRAPPGLKSIKQRIYNGMVITISKIKNNNALHMSMSNEKTSMKFHLSNQLTGKRVSGGLLTFLPRLSSWNWMSCNTRAASVLLVGGSAWRYWTRNKTKPSQHPRKIVNTKRSGP